MDDWSPATEQPEEPTKLQMHASQGWQAILVHQGEEPEQDAALLLPMMSRRQVALMVSQLPHLCVWAAYR